MERDLRVAAEHLLAVVVQTDRDDHRRRLPATQRPSAVVQSRGAGLDLREVRRVVADALGEQRRIRSPRDRSRERVEAATIRGAPLAWITSVDRHRAEAAQHEAEQRHREQAVPRAEHDHLGEAREHEPGIDEPVRMPRHQQPTSSLRDVLEPEHLDAAEERPRRRA
jgi:hypothetical protein